MKNRQNGDSMALVCSSALLHEGKVMETVTVLRFTTLCKLPDSPDHCLGAIYFYAPKGIAILEIGETPEKIIHKFYLVPDVRVRLPHCEPAALEGTVEIPKSLLDEAKEALGLV